jgi:hypothetical protein
MSQQLWASPAASGVGATLDAGGGGWHRTRGPGGRARGWGQESERGRWQAGVSGGLRKGRGRGLGCGMRGDDGCVTAVNGGRWESGAEDRSGGRRGRARVWTLTLLS